MIGDSLHAPGYLSRGDNNRKIWARRQRTDVGKYSFVNKTIADWNQLPEEVIRDSHCKPHMFRKRVRIVISCDGE